MAKMIERICKCGCGRKFSACKADVDRGWGLYATKSCKARAQEKRTHQYSNYLNGNPYGGTSVFDRHGDYVGFVDINGSDGHDCNKS
jgi:hypothetical protein